jgi:hypothetical protein
LQAQDGSFVGTVQDQNNAGQTDMVGFDSSGNIQWTVPNEQPKVATADGGVIGQSGIIYGQGGNATGVIANMPTYSWLGNAYQVGSVDHVVPQPLFAAMSFWAFMQATTSGGKTSAHNQWFPELESCTDNRGTCQGSIGPRDRVYNARNDLVRQLKSDSACLTAAQQLLNKIPQGGFIGFLAHGIDGATFISYLQNIQHFYNGATSTLLERIALCGENDTTCSQFTTPGQLTNENFQPNGDTTAQTVTPSYPQLKTSWQPVYQGPSGPSNPNDPNYTDGFGVGIDPTDYGVNIYNESNLFHEALHGFTDTWTTPRAYNITWA